MRRVDLCLSTEGSEVVLATSSDDKHPPENMIDGNPETFWTTTGMFPQEFIICFHKHVKIEKLIIQSYLVQTLRIEKSTSKEPAGFELWVEKDLVHTEGQLQNEEIVEEDKNQHPPQKKKKEKERSRGRKFNVFQTTTPSPASPLPRVPEHEVTS
ncbi:intraflagellar transport protein 25 homolog isoform 1-T4 [Thomomys bottae]